MTVSLPSHISCLCESVCLCCLVFASTASSITIQLTFYPASESSVHLASQAASNPWPRVSVPSNSTIQPSIENQSVCYVCVCVCVSVDLFVTLLTNFTIKLLLLLWLFYSGLSSFGVVTIIVVVVVSIQQTNCQSVDVFMLIVVVMLLLPVF